MTQEFRLPDIGEGLTEAEIVRWLVAEGEVVTADQPVVEVETDKAVVEIPTPYAGVLLKHGAAEGETIEVGAVLIVVGDETDTSGSDDTLEMAPAVAEEETATSPEPEPAPAAAPAPIVGTLDEDAEDLSARPQPGGAQTDQIKALPLVRKLARESGIDLTTVTGTGPGGRIVREDVLRAVAAGAGAIAEAPVAMEPAELEPAEPEPSVAGPETETGQDKAISGEPAAEDGRIPMTRLRRTIAANMARSWAEIPHVTTFDEVDATRLLEVRRALSARHDAKVSIDALVVKAVVPALQAFPDFNSRIDGDDLIVHASLDIGIAVDTPVGLLVAVIRGAESRDVLDLSAEIQRLAEGAKARTLSPDELAGQTFTVSNIGALGGGLGTPIVPYGTTAILSVGRAQQKPVVVDGDLDIAPMMPLSLSYDHRVIDGGQGRRFMAHVIENLEEPALFLA